MKRVLILLLAMMLCISFTACSKGVGGRYKLEYITADGVRIQPSNLGLNVSFELSEDGIGTAAYGSTNLNITWAEDGNDVVVRSEDKELRFSRDGKNLILHDEGTVMYFVPEETEGEEED